MRVNVYDKPWYFTVATVQRCSVARDPQGHKKDAVITRVGYANDSVKVTCTCGGEWKAMTYAKPKAKRR